jgi:hypothetical protein
MTVKDRPPLATFFFNWAIFSMESSYKNVLSSVFTKLLEAKMSIDRNYILLIFNAIEAKNGVCYG